MNLLDVKNGDFLAGPVSLFGAGSSQLGADDPSLRQRRRSSPSEGAAAVPALWIGGAGRLPRREGPLGYLEHPREGEGI